MSPRRIQRKRTKGWRMPENAAYVGRGTRWGNPFRVGTLIRIPATDGTDWEPEGRIGKTPGDRHPYHHPGGDVTWHLVVAVTAPAEAADWYRRWVAGGGPAGIWDGRRTVWRTRALENLRLLAGRDLACWCGPDDACHADVLLELANGRTDR